MLAAGQVDGPTLVEDTSLYCAPSRPADRTSSGSWINSGTRA